MNGYGETIQKLEWQIHAEMEQLNVGITAEDLQWLQLPFSAEKTWNQLKSDMDQVMVTKEQLEEEHRQLLKEEEYLHVQKDKQQASLADTEREKELQETVHQYHRQKQMLHDQDEQTWNWDQLKKQKEKQAAAWLTGGIAAAVILSVLAFITDRMTLLGISGVILAASIGQWTAGKRSHREMERMLVSKKPASGEITENEKQEAEKTLAANDEMKQELSIVQEKLRSNEMTFLKWEEKKSGLEQRENRVQRQIKEQWKQYPFLEQMDSAHWPALFHPLKHVLELHRDKQRQEQAYEQQLQKSRHFDERIDHFSMN